MTFTLRQLEQLQQDGKIRGYVDKMDTKKTDVDIPKRSGHNRHKTKEWIGKNLWYWCQANNLELVTELVFHGERKWRFDWAIESIKVAIEYEGIGSKVSRHTTASGYTGDAEKYNAAAQLGWRVMRYTSRNYKTLLEDLNKFLCNS